MVAFFLFFIFYFSFFITAPAVYADISCHPIYGGGQTCVNTGSILINKKILNPSDNIFVDNLGVNDPKYAPGFIVNFRLEITNSKDTNVSRIEVKDVFPQYVEFASGPGKFDAKTKTLTFTIDNLTPNATRVFGIVGKVAGINQLPVNQETVCIINQATATHDENVSQDNSQFCIEKKVSAKKGGFPVVSPPAISSSPSTGPESLLLFSMIPLGIAGWLLRKYSPNK